MFTMAIMPKLTLENEKTTFTEDETLTAHAVRTLGPKHKVFIARLKDGSDADFLLFEDQDIIYGSKSFEDVAVRIDIPGLIKDKKGNHG